MIKTIERIEHAIDLLIPKVDTPPVPLHSAMRYSMENGGKRLRPLLVLAAYEGIGGKGLDPMPVAVAIECVHAYSLIHDDLPCMDNSDLRRGRPSCHRVFGEAMALLAGDALLTLAFEILGEKYLSVVGATLAQACGSRALIGGQAQDILSEKEQALSAETLSFIHAGKTAALMACAVSMGARLAGANPGVLVKIHQMGHAFGMAYQLFDDIQDAVGAEEVLGKPVGQDALHHKPSALRLYSIPEAREKAQSYLDEARALANEVLKVPTHFQNVLDLVHL